MNFANVPKFAVMPRVYQNKLLPYKAELLLLAGFATPSYSHHSLCQCHILRLCGRNAAPPILTKWNFRVRVDNLLIFAF